MSIPFGKETEHDKLIQLTVCPIPFGKKTEYAIDAVDSVSIPFGKKTEHLWTRNSFASREKFLWKLPVSSSLPHQPGELQLNIH